MNPRLGVSRDPLPLAPVRRQSVAFPLAICLEDSPVEIPRSPAQLRRMRDSRLERLASVRPFVAASLVESARTCGNPNCRCASGDKHTGFALTFKLEGKTRTVYVPKDRVEEVRQWVMEHRRLKDLLTEISTLTIELLRAEGRVNREVRKRESS